MKYHTLSNSDLKIPVLMLGTATFGGGNEFFRKWGDTDVKEASSMVDLALDAGCNMFDTADAYSAGLSEEILGQAVKAYVTLAPGSQLSERDIVRHCLEHLESHMTPKFVEIVDDLPRTESGKIRHASLR